MTPEQAAHQVADPQTVAGMWEELAVLEEHADDVQALAWGTIGERFAVVALTVDGGVVVAYGPGRPRVEVLPSPLRVWCGQYGSMWRLQLVYADRVVDLQQCRRDAAEAVEASLT